MIIERDIKDLMAKTLERGREGIHMQMKMHRICCRFFFCLFFSAKLSNCFYGDYLIKLGHGKEGDVYAVSQDWLAFLRSQSINEC